jgi:hypothetical protein
MEANIKLFIIIIIIIYLLYFIIQKNVTIEYFTDLDVLTTIDKTIYSPSLSNNSILNPIEMKYTTFDLSLTSKNDILFTQIIIENFKTILQRGPTPFELNFYKSRFVTNEIDEEYLKTILFNLYEYSNNINLGSNEINAGLEQYTYKNKLSKLIMNLYEKYVKEFIPNKPKLIPILRDIYTHLRFDMYVFIAVLLNKGYINLETELLQIDILTKRKVYELFYEYISMDEVIDIANEIKREDLIDGKSDILNGLDIDITKTKEKIRKFKEDNDITGSIADAVKKRDLFNKDDCAQNLDKIENQSIKRYYNTSSKNVNPQVCNMIGNAKNGFLPLYPNSKNLFQGSDIKTAYNDTEVGSIMPKFEFREYIDVIEKNNTTNK